ncbi:MAG TPA: tannase/feruloyl esterase family alpha/beta hydrolase [Streptosporangiaceae bacterium]
MRFRTRQVTPIITALLLLGGGGAATAQTTAQTTARNMAHAAAAAEPSVVTPKMDCAALAALDLSGVPGAPAVVGSATVGTAPLGWEACDVKGTVAPQIQFEALLPTKTWRQRYLQTGCGGFCGNVTINAQAATGCVPLTRGDFVMATNNEGHVSAGGFDGVFGTDPQLRVDYGYQADHLVSLVVKRLIATYYGQGPRHSYFDGCSQGGHQGLTEAQRYPADFDGIIAGAPASIFIALNVMYQGWNARANTDAHGRPILTADKLPALHAAVLANCDGKDGLVDGQIDDPRACAFDPATIRCTGADSASCLTAAQVDAVRKLYAGPRDARGRRLYPGGQAVGSESAWVPWLVPAAPGAATIDQGVVTNTLKYLAFASPRPTMTADDLSFDAATFRTVSEQSGIYDATDPDLSAFRARGGKLILWHGWADPAISPYGTVAYYHAVTERMGGQRATERFARLFMLPGVNHCGGGQAPNSIDALTPMLGWVEQGTPPDRLVASETQGGSVVRTRPVFPYPLVARYDGTGSTDDAANFVAAPPPAHFEDAIPWLGSFRSGYERTCTWRNGHWVCTRSGHISG